MLAQTATKDRTAAEVQAIVEQVGGLVGLLGVGQPSLRSSFLRGAGFTAVYHPRSRSVEASSNIGVRKVVSEGGLELMPLT
ncbi:MAG: hypothetical protein M3P70_03145 [Actinomycetota bacterium]|nr:hypothetical protein [Actinomycetota bacterium]